MSAGLFPARRVMWMDPDGVPASFAGHGVRHCCADMETALSNRCEDHAHDPFACADMLLCYSPVFDEYGLVIHDGTSSYLLVDACPFCAAKLPESARDRFFDAVEALGLDPFDDELPERFRTAAWRREAAGPPDP